MKRTNKRKKFNYAMDLPLMNVKKSSEKTNVRFGAISRNS